VSSTTRAARAPHAAVLETGPPSSGSDTADQAVPARWHAHSLNQPFIWRLIFGLTPRLPAFLVAPLRHITAGFCFLWLVRERAAVRRNLKQVTGASGWAAVRQAYRVFHNFSGFMVAYASLRRFGPAWLLERLEGEAEVDAALRGALGEGRGVILLTMHLGQWDLGLSLLRHIDAPVHVVMRREEPADVSRLAGEARNLPGLRVHQAGDSPLLGVELMAALLRNEIVAVQADRAFGNGVLPTPLFGRMAPLPTGPVRLALATGAPILPVFTVLAPGNRFRLLALEPLRLPRRRGEGIEQAVADAMPHLARILQPVIARYPEQWFNFYDVWPDTAPAADDEPEESRAV
jgi:phosphatidylinositol dimannoside acyltransferase